MNFAQPRDGELLVRTYERGVEGRRAGVRHGRRGLRHPRRRAGDRVAAGDRADGGGEILKVYFDAGKEGFGEVYLEGDTSWTFDGRLFEEAYRY